MFKRIDDALNRAENFMSGFEDDKEQEGVVETLELIRGIQADIENDPPTVKGFFVYVDKLADIASAFWSNKDGWGAFSNATIFSDDLAESVNPPMIELGQSAERIAIDKVPAFLSEADLRAVHGENRMHNGYPPIALAPNGAEGSDFKMLYGRSVHIDVRNLSVQLSIQDDGLSVYVYANGTGHTLVETFASFNEAAQVFFGDSTEGSSLEENLESWTTNWRDYVHAHLAVDPTMTDQVKSCIAKSDQTWVDMDKLKDLVIQTVAALPDPALSGRYFIDPDAVRALQKLVHSDDPMEIRKGLAGADGLLLKAWPALEAPMELVHGIREVTFTL